MSLSCVRVKPGFYRALGGRVEIHHVTTTQTKTRHGKTVGYKESGWFAIVDGKRCFMDWPTKKDAVEDAERVLGINR